MIIFGDATFVDEIKSLATRAEIPSASVLDCITNVRKPIKILRAEPVEAYCPPDRLDEVPDFEKEIIDKDGSLV